LSWTGADLVYKGLHDSGTTFNYRGQRQAPVPQAGNTISVQRPPATGCATSSAANSAASTG
jgi:hypothetical protein